MKSQQTCDVCGKPATMFVRDMMRHEVPTEMFVQFSPLSTIRAGCDEHPVEPREYVTELPPPEPHA